jgi:peptidoglycan hydrolase CwlO-like protein
MNLKFIVAVLVIAAVPLCAQAQQKGTPNTTKADAQKVITIISGDKAKAKLYCDISALGEQIDAAAQKKDEKKIDELSQKADDMGTKIGPEYVALMNGLQEMDPNSKEAGDIGTMLEALDKLCTK